MSDTAAADRDDIRHDDLEFDVDIQPAKKSKAWLAPKKETQDGLA